MFKRFSGTKVRKIYNIRKKKRKILANIEKKQYFCAAKIDAKQNRWLIRN